MVYFFIKVRNIHHTLHMGLQSFRHHVNVIRMKKSPTITHFHTHKVSDTLCV